MVALKLLDGIFLINERAAAFRVLFAGILSTSVVTESVVTASEKYCILLPLGTL